MLAGLSGCFGLPVIVTLLTPSVPWAGSTAFKLSVLTTAVAVVITCVRGTVDWRVAVLAAPALLPDVAITLPFLTWGPVSTAFWYLWLGSLALAVIVWPVAIASWRGRVRRASRAAAGQRGGR
jgi:hypothetical protein